MEPDAGPSLRKRLRLSTLLIAAVSVAAVATPSCSGPDEEGGETTTSVDSAAVLIVLGRSDAKRTDWSCEAVVEGAAVVARETLRFKPGDELTETGWTAFSHPGLMPSVLPSVSRGDTPGDAASIGLVFHVEDVRPGATLSIRPLAQELEAVELPLAEILDGQPRRLWDGRGYARRTTVTAPLFPGPTQDDFPAAAYAPDGTLWLAFVRYALRVPKRAESVLYVAEEPERFDDLFHPEGSDQLVLTPLRDGEWSSPIVLTSAAETIAACALAVDGDGVVTVVYSRQEDLDFDLFERAFDPRADEGLGPERAVASASGPDLAPALCTDSLGNVWLAYQSWAEGRATVRVLRRDPAGWTQRADVARGLAGNAWRPALAADESGGVAVAYDVYRGGDYDVVVALFRGEGEPRRIPVASSARFEARPSIAFGGERFWIAYEAGPERWGKDFGALIVKKGNPLGSTRSIQVVALEADGSLSSPVARLPESRSAPPKIPYSLAETLRFESDTRFANPSLAIDGLGRVWLTYRRNYGHRYTTHVGGVWKTNARCLQGDRWSPEILVHHSDGRLDAQSVQLARDDGGLLLLHTSDERGTMVARLDDKLYASVVDLPGGGEPAVRALPAAAKPRNALHEREREDVARIRAHRVEVGGATYRIFRGELHRHTDISIDGSADGSLEDMFRYAFDAADLDWIASTDHENGGGREYPWWLTQKANEAYHLPGRFAPLFAYERGVPFPQGHRNCLFAQRGVLSLPRLFTPIDPRNRDVFAGAAHADDLSMLYRYLRAMDGICSVHTSASVMGTDWSEHDPDLEPIVEIYQGDRMSYEYDGAPRTGSEDGSDGRPVNIGGWQPEGFIDVALRKGLRLGFQSSSDHWSTHASYTMVLAPELSREAVLDAMRRRHTYAATDNVILDVTSGDSLMGDEIETREAPALDLHVVGTAPLARVEVLRDSEVVFTARPEGPSLETAWTDPSPLPGAHYYYVRVIQTDGELAWSSPLWFAPPSD